MRRRDVIKSGAAAAAGLVAVPAVRSEPHAPDQASPEPWIALLSDPHIDTAESKVVKGVNMAEHLTEVIHRLRAATQRPEHVMINGDCALGSGETGDYALLRRLLSPMEDEQWSVRLALGNHDHRERFIEGLGRSSEIYRTFGRHHQAIRGHGNSVWLILDSLRETDEVAGELGPVQRQWISDQLDQIEASDPTARVFLLTHHQPEDPKDPDDDGYGLADSNALIDLLWNRRQVKAIFHGHKHAWGIREANGIHIVGLPATSYVFKDGEQPGYVEARVRPDHIELTQRCLNAQHPAEGQTHALAYR
ncbi:metallophosphoesterase family protein [Algisphaera agarilytica]|uniref:3',5'-cyclic AMP phosphodiesterase CpdA n=1 Tax=Algisphaera agarilytica TaxID=1385975 RepID=A0A7X0HBF2_9BACT|nr:metallophosphoesterase [Algisphaera agarilytica]MBB6431631.1 3',5'-cyclic AMP phosphodiesterase CpdA [Algisphaera agarilytica]